LRIFLLTTITMIAFGANSIFGRVALEGDAIDPSSYSFIRLLSGAIMLAILVGASSGVSKKSLSHGNLISALCLFAYAAAFSFSYVNIETGVGALILFACVQAVMIGWALFKGLVLSSHLAPLSGLYHRDLKRLIPLLQRSWQFPALHGAHIL
jgi:hypothetical protein